MTMPSRVLFSSGSLVRVQRVCGRQGLEAGYKLQVLRADGGAILGFRSFQGQVPRLYGWSAERTSD